MCKKIKSGIFSTSLRWSSSFSLHLPLNGLKCPEMQQILFGWGSNIRLYEEFQPFFFKLSLSQLGQLPREAGGCAWEVRNTNEILSVWHLFFRMAMLVTLFLVLINIFNSVRWTEICWYQIDSRIVRGFSTILPPENLIK